MKLARKWVVCFSSWILYYYQISNNSLLKRYCKNKAWKPAIKAVWSPRCCLLPSLEALEANVRNAKTNLVKVALRNLTPQLCSEQQTPPCAFQQTQGLLRFSTLLPWKPILLGFTAGSWCEAKLRHQAGFYIELHPLTLCGQECEKRDNSNSELLVLTSKAQQ